MFVSKLVRPSTRFVPKACAKMTAREAEDEAQANRGGQCIGIVPPASNDCVQIIEGLIMILQNQQTLEVDIKKAEKDGKTLDF